MRVRVSMTCLLAVGMSPYRANLPPFCVCARAQACGDVCEVCVRAVYWILGEVKHGPVLLRG